MSMANYIFHVDYYVKVRSGLSITNFEKLKKNADFFRSLPPYPNWLATV